jgi:hypothetical protein
MPALFELDGAEAADGRVPAFSVVPCFDVFEDCGSGFSACSHGLLNRCGELAYLSAKNGPGIEGPRGLGAREANESANLHGPLLLEEV